MSPDEDNSGPVGRARATLIGPDSVLVLSPKLLLVLVVGLLSIVVPAITLYTDVDRRIERAEETTTMVREKLRSEVASKRDLADLGKDLRHEIRAVSDAAQQMRMNCEPTRGGGLRCQVRQE